MIHTSMQHVDEITLEEEQRVVAQPRHDAGDDVDCGEVDEQRPVCMNE